MRHVVHLLVCESCGAESPEARSRRQAAARARAEGWALDPDRCPQCPPGPALAEVIPFGRPTHLVEVHSGAAGHRIVGSWPATARTEGGNG